MGHVHSDIFWSEDITGAIHHHSMHALPLLYNLCLSVNNGVVLIADRGFHL